MTDLDILATAKIANLRVRPSVCDEWYGVEVDFDWRGFDYDAYIAPAKGDYGAIMRRDTVLRNVVVPQVLISEEWKQFYATPRSVTCEAYEDGPEITVVIPRFKYIENFGDFDFDTKGGNVGAVTDE